MDKNQKLDCINQINKLQNLDFLLAILAYGAAPTINHIKPSNLLTLTLRKDLLANWLHYKEEVLERFELQSIELRKGTHSQTILFYKEDILKKHLSKSQNTLYLKKQGYNLEKSIIKQLKDNYKESFPHEIGVFLGIPIADIEGFVINKGKNYLINRYWKVYDNLDNALKTFCLYDKIRLSTIKELGYYN